MVAETENRIVGSQARKRLDRVDFPAPEGEERIMRRPRLLVMLLFHVLYLFAHLVDHRFEVQPDPSKCDRLRLGTQGVGLPIEFLHQEIELAPGRAALGDQFARGLDMCVQAIQFFGHIGFYGDQRQFLRDAVRIGAICIVQHACKIDL